jgi:L-threonylcarbamoyladenylate synthase
LAVYNLSPNGNLAEAAQQLFRVLRLIAERKYEYVAVQLLPEKGLGMAINDRLRRAAATE